MRERLLINGEDVDIRENDITLTFQANQLNNLKDRQVSYSENFTLLDTAKNRATLKIGIIGETNVVTVYDNVSYDIDGITIFEKARAVIRKTNYKGIITYECQILGIEHKLRELEKLSLKDLEYNWFINIYDWYSGGNVGDSIENHLNANLNRTGDVSIPLMAHFLRHVYYTTQSVDVGITSVNYFQKSDNPDYPVQSLVYVFNLRYLIQKAFEQIGLNANLPDYGEVINTSIPISCFCGAQIDDTDYRYTITNAEVQNAMHDINLLKLFKDYCFRHGLIYFYSGNEIKFTKLNDILNGNNGTIDYTPIYSEVKYIEQGTPEDLIGVYKAKGDFFYYMDYYPINTNFIYIGSDLAKKNYIDSRGVQRDIHNDYTEIIDATYTRKDSVNTHKSNTLFSVGNTDTEIEIEWIWTLFVDESMNESITGVTDYNPIYNVAYNFVNKGREATSNNELNYNINHFKLIKNENKQIFNLKEINTIDIYHRNIKIRNTGEFSTATIFTYTNEFQILQQTDTTPERYKSNWTGWIDILNKYEKVVILARMKITDILNLDLLKRVYIEQLGGYFYIEKIKNWKKNNELIEIELIRI